MEDLIAMIMCVQILADDLHYRSRGTEFYSHHLLADRVKDGLDKQIDAIKESYWLGELRVVPPTTDRLMSAACSFSAAHREGSKGKSLVGVLLGAVNDLVHRIEQVKANENPMSGTTAILDGVSQSMLVALGLLDRTENAQ